jgi:hypothetical protein
VVLSLVWVFVLFLVLWLFRRMDHKRSLIKSLGYILIQARLPRQTGQDRDLAQTRERLSVMEHLYSALGGLLNSPQVPYLGLELAVHYVGEETHFYIITPRASVNDIEKLIHSSYPEALVEPVEDYNIFNPNGVSAASTLKLNREAILPLRTYRDTERDPFEAIVTALTKLEKEGEGAAVQIIFTRASKKWSKKAVKIAQIVQSGKSLGDALHEQSTLGQLLSLFEGSSKKKDESKEGDKKEEEKVKDEETAQAIKSKAAKTAFSVNVRLVTSANTQERAQDILRQLENSFEQFDSAQFNNLSFKKNKGRALKKLVYNFIFRIFEPADVMTLNTEELTSMAHFSVSGIKTPQLKMIKAREAPVPANMPHEGLVLGKNVFRGQETLVRIEEDDRRRHLYIIGQTGTGKSSFLSEMVRQDIQSDKGICLIDPHGDLAESMLGFVPAERVKDVIYFNPGDVERPLGMNMLEYDPARPEQKPVIVSELLSIFDKLYNMSTAGGPMFEQYMSNALLLVMDDPATGNTLLEVPRVLSDKNFRKMKLARCKNVVVKNFWELEAEKAGGEAALQNMVPYITSKLNTFITNDIMRNIIAQPTSAFNFQDVMDSGKILLVNLSKGRLGELNSSLLGLIVVGKILLASFSRVDMPESERRDFYLYLDEFQNVTTNSIATILSEARKYRLSLTLAHQFIGQLQEDIKKAVFGNVGSMVAFRVGTEDGEFIEKQFEPSFSNQDLINLDNFKAAAKLMIKGQTSTPFSLETIIPQQGDEELIKQLKEYSRLTYGRAKEEIEQNILKRHSGVSQAPSSSAPPPPQPTP